MINLSSLTVTLQNIQAAYKKLEKDKLSLEELDTLLENSKELYDRAVILRYKAFEEKVFGVEEKAIFTSEEELSDEPIITSEIPTFEMGSMSQEEVKEEVTEHPAFDFSLFDDTSEVVKNEILPEETIEHVSVTSVSSESNGIHEDKIIMEQVKETPVAPENKKFIEKYSKTDHNAFQQISMSKLDTLIGTFGLNERLQYINELFDGSSEDFAEAIKEINNVSSIEDALIKASKFANQFNWDNDSETVEEFVIKIKRRYA